MDEERDERDQQLADAFEAHGDLIERLARGDVHALDSLLEATTGVRVVASRTITPAQ